MLSLKRAAVMNAPQKNYNKKRRFTYDAASITCRKALLFSQLKSREIYRLVFPINKSGTKQVSVSLDPAFDFQCFVSIGRVGWSGVQLTKSAWISLLSASEKITNFFNGVYNENIFNEEFNISHEEKILFRNQYGENVITLATVRGTSDYVTLGKSSWKGLIKLVNIVSYCLDEYETYTSDAMEFFASYTKALKERLPEDIQLENPQMNSMQKFEDFLQGVTFDCVLYSPFRETSLDFKKLFFELQAFCAVDLAGYMSCV
jgi:hypothetical protein